MAIQSTIMLNNGTVIPQVGLGVFQTPDGDTTVNAVQTALENGYRHIDTAMIYRNEASVGEGIRRAGVPRSDFFLTTKLWNDDIRARHGKDAFQESLDRLGVDYVDLYLIHWPADGWQQAWDDLQEIYASGRAKAIGVSNFQKHHIDELLTHSDMVPAVDQIESSPQFTNQELIGQLRAKGIHTEAWSPLGGTGGNLLSNPVLAEIGAKYGKSPAQGGLPPGPAQRYERRRGQPWPARHPERSGQGCRLHHLPHQRLHLCADRVRHPHPDPEGRQGDPLLRG